VKVRNTNHVRFYLAVLLIGALVMGIAVALAADPSEPSASEQHAGGNSKCYVCHPGLKTEQITTTHLEMDITCDVCHGPSVEHMHDEMLMTEPDLLYGRAEVNRMCSNPTCHKPGADRPFYGRQDHMDQQAVEEFFKKWRGRMRPNGRTVGPDSVCTDCHGTHNLDKAEEKPHLDSQPAEWVSLFNGKDLTGWRPAEPQLWQVSRGRIIGRPAPDRDSILWTQNSYRDYLLAVTWRADWPIHAAIQVRGTNPNEGARIEIVGPEADHAYTGSVLAIGKGLALINLDKQLVDYEGWNTLSVKVQGQQVQVWLNGESVGAVRVPGATAGPLGLYLAKGPKGSLLTVREIQLQPIISQQTGQGR